MDRGIGLRVLGVLLLAALALGTTTASPAWSAEEQTFTHRYVPELFNIAPPGANQRIAGNNQWLYPQAVAVPKAEVEDVTLTIDASGLAGVAAFNDKGGCDADGLDDDDAVITCTEGIVDGNGVQMGEFQILADADAEVGDSGVVRFELSAAGATPDAWTMRVDVGTPKLTVGRIAEPRGFEPGDDFTMPVRIVNEGTQPARGLYVFISAEGPIWFDNIGGPACHYMEGRRAVGGSAYCRFDVVLDPGEAVRFDQLVRVRSGTKLTFANVFVGASTSGEAATQDWFFPKEFSVQGSGPAMRLLPTGQTGATVDFVDFWVSGGTTDFAALGASVVGAVGETVEVKVGARNLGPSDIQLYDRPAPYALEFVPPPGTTVVEIGQEEDPWGCEPGEGGAASYTCETRDGSHSPGRAQKVVFQLRIDERVQGAAGSVQLTPREQGPWSINDPDPDNDDAVVRLKVVGQAGPAPSDDADGDSPVWPWAVGGAAILVLGSGAIRKFAMSTTGS